MKKVLMSLVCLCCISSAARAFIFMGCPTGDVQQDPVGMGANYSYSEADITIEGMGVDDVEFSSYLARIAYGATDEWGVFVSVGTADVEADDYDGSSEFAFGIGVKGVFHEGEHVSWGALSQIHWFKSKDTGRVDGLSADGEFDLYEVQVGAGPIYQADGFCVYGGPFLDFIRGDFDVRIRGRSVPGEIKEESKFGGYVGGQIQIWNDATLGVEVQITGDGFAVGIAFFSPIP